MALVPRATACAGVARLSERPDSRKRMLPQQTMTEATTMSTKPTQTPRAHRLSVNVLALHDLWRARDPREHVSTSVVATGWRCAGIRLWCRSRPSFPLRFLPTPERQRSEPALSTGAEPSAAYRVEPGRQGGAG